MLIQIQVQIPPKNHFNLLSDQYSGIGDRTEIKIFGFESACVQFLDINTC